MAWEFFLTPLTVNVYKFGAEVQHRWQNLLLLALPRMNVPTDSAHTGGKSQYIKRREHF